MSESQRVSVSHEKLRSTMQMAWMISDPHFNIQGPGWNLRYARDHSVSGIVGQSTSYMRSTAQQDNEVWTYNSTFKAT